MAIDRAATVKKAEILLGEGKLEAAISEYVRLVEDSPSDWSAGNTLGDLYVRAGDRDKAADQFRQIADSQYRQGFVSKATAFYKKALRVRNGDEHSLAQLAAIAASQELLGDAKGYLTSLLRQRRERDDKAGAAECLVRISALDEDDGDAKLAAARAGKGIFDTERTARLFVDAADTFERQDKHEQAKAAILELGDIEVRDPELRRRITELTATGAAEAPSVPDPEPSASTPLVDTFSAVSSGTPDLSIPPPPATLEVETSTGQTLSFDTREETAEAVPEPSPEPAATPDLTSEPTPEPVMAEAVPEVEPIPHVDLMAMLDDSREPPRAAQQESESIQDDEPIVLDVAEVSSDAGVSFASPPSVEKFPSTPSVKKVPDVPVLSRVPNPPNPPSPQSVSADVKARFEERLARSVRQTRAQELALDVSTQAPESEDGDGDVVAQLEAAARTPSLEFQASAQLGRLLIARGDLQRGVDWLERAARAPIQIPDHAMAVQYEIADVLERMGEGARALEVLRELEAHAGAYRDVQERIARLTRGSARS